MLIPQRGDVAKCVAATAQLAASEGVSADG